MTRITTRALTGSRPESGSSRHTRSGLGNERPADLHLLLIAFRQLLDFPVGVLGQIEACQPGRGGVRAALGAIPFSVPRYSSTAPTF
jgi:hypothetical protein